MRVDIVINKNKGLPNGTAAALEQELSGRLLKQFSDCRVFVRLGSQDSLSVLGGDKDAKKEWKPFFRKRGKAQKTGFIEVSLTGLHSTGGRDDRITNAEERL